MADDWVSGKINDKDQLRRLRSTLRDLDQKGRGDPSKTMEAGASARGAVQVWPHRIAAYMGMASALEGIALTLAGWTTAAVVALGVMLMFTLTAVLFRAGLLLNDPYEVRDDRGDSKNETPSRFIKPSGVAFGLAYGVMGVSAAWKVVFGYTAPYFDETVAVFVLLPIILLSFAAGQVLNKAGL